MKIAYWILIGIAVVGVCATAAKAASNKPPLTPDATHLRNTDRIEITPDTSQHIASTTNKLEPPVITPKAYRYTRIRWRLYFVRTAYGFLILLGLLATGFSAKMRNMALKLSRRKFITLFWYTLLLSATITLLCVPFSYYSGFWLEHDFGLSNQKLGSWLQDYAKGFGIDLAVTTIVLWIVYWLINNKRRWDMWLWAAFIPMIAFGIFIEPLVISPMFNKFTPLPQGHLRTEIQKLAVKAGIPNAPIYVSDVSKQTNTTNAYVDGIGHSARIVVWDTTLKKMPEDEILSIVAHEMGHYALKHIFWGFLETIGGLLILLPLARRIYETMVEKNKACWQLDGKGDFAAIPAIMLTMSLLSFAIEPVVNAISRNVEHQADVYGLELNGDRVAMAKSFIDLSDQNLSDPNPPAFIKFWLYSHPTLKERVEFALGEPEK